MKTASTILAAVVLLTIIFGMTYRVEASTVEFFAVDSNGDGGVSISIYNLDPLGTGFYLEYYDNETSDWMRYSEPFNVQTPGGTGRVSLHLTNGSETLTDGEMLFLGSAGQLDGLDVYNMLLVDWGNINLSAVVSGDSDLLAAVPIPASALLLGSGVIGLIGFRRKSVKRALLSY